MAPVDGRVDQASSSILFSGNLLPLQRRDGTSKYNPGVGAVDPANFSGPGFIALFAIVGAGMVIATMWFFFWAKNGGFHWRSTDWEDYKSTVLRRKGPDGRTLSNATKSTRLGGDSIAGTQHYQWTKQVARSVVGRDEKGRKGILAKRGWGGTHSVTYSDDYLTESLATRTVGDMAEVRADPEYTPHSNRYHDRDVREYKREKPARVGGLNRVPDGSHFDTTNTDRSVVTDTMTESSDQPMLARENRARERAERKAREEAARMERQWRKDAEAAAAALAREEPSRPTPPKSAAPAGQPSARKQRRESRNEPAPKKKVVRDFSYQDGPESEILSTAYTASSSGAGSGQRPPSYYDSYRPTPAQGRHEEERSTAPAKKTTSRPKQSRAGGYRRGADSELD